jgi:hypothetical protein
VPQIARVGDVLRKWARVAISVDWQPAVTGWRAPTIRWTLLPSSGKRVDALYQAIPDMGGFVLADRKDASGLRGRTYGRGQCGAARSNLTAALFYRGFV